jgi:hypothetical protein
MTTPAIGVKGYKGALKPLFKYGFFFLSFRRERLTKAKTRIDPKLAA